MPTVTIDSTTQRFTSGAMPEADICILHTTEGVSWPGYSGGATAPHATIKPLPNVGIEVREHIDPTQFAKALMNLPGGVETNRRGALQYELMGTCDPSHKGQDGWYYWPEADAVVIAALAQYLRPRLTAWNIPLKAPAFKPYPASYGANGVRLSGSDWLAFEGVLGHQHVPENDHGDPGDFPIDALLKALTPPPASVIPPIFKKIAQKVTAAALVVDGDLGPATIRQWQKVMGTPVDGVISRPSALIRAVQGRIWFSRSSIDGILGPKTWRGIQNHLGVAADGVPGPITIKALQRRLNTNTF